jgi:hypothetical protein
MEARVPVAILRGSALRAERLRMTAVLLRMLGSILVIARFIVIHL